MHSLINHLLICCSTTKSQFPRKCFQKHISHAVSYRFRQHPSTFEMGWMSGIKWGVKMAYFIFKSDAYILCVIAALLSLWRIRFTPSTKFVSLYVASSRCSLSSTFYCSFPSKHASVGSIQCNDDGRFTKQVSDICRSQRDSFQLRIRTKMTENETFLTWWLMNLNMIKSLFFLLSTHQNNPSWQEVAQSQGLTEQFVWRLELISLKKLIKAFWMVPWPVKSAGQATMRGDRTK